MNSVSCWLLSLWIGYLYQTHKSIAVFSGMIIWRWIADMGYLETFPHNPPNNFFYKRQSPISVALASVTEHYPVSTFRRTLSQILPVMVKNMLLISYGFAASLPAILIPQLSERGVDERLFLNKERVSWIGSIISMGVPVGCLASGITTSVFGRKRTMQFICIPFILCFIGLSFVNNVWQIYMILAILGLSAGVCEAPVVTYVAEITEPNLRGILTATGSFATLLGMLLELTFGTVLKWNTAALVSVVGPSMAFLLLFFVPESPYWLISKNRIEEAKQDLAWLRGWTTVESVEEEFQELMAVYKTAGQARKQLHFREYLKRDFLFPLALVAFLFVVTGFSGSSAIQLYAVKIFSALQVPIDPYYASIILGSSLLLGTLPCIILIHYIGKRILTFFSLLIGGICLIIVACYAYIINVTQLEFLEFSQLKLTCEQCKWTNLISLVVCAFAMQAGIRTVPWILVGEVFPRNTNKLGAAIAGTIAHLINFFSNKIFLQTVDTLTLPGTFGLFSVVCIIGVAILYFWLPETEGKTIEEISGHFSGMGQLDNKVRRKQKINDTETML